MTKRKSRRGLLIGLLIFAALLALCLALMAFHNAPYYQSPADLFLDVWLLLHAQMRYNWDEDVGLQSWANVFGRLWLYMTSPRLGPALQEIRRMPTNCYAPGALDHFDLTFVLFDVQRIFPTQTVSQFEDDAVRVYDSRADLYTKFDFETGQRHPDRDTAFLIFHIRRIFEKDGDEERYAGYVCGVERQGVVFENYYPDCYENPQQALAQTDTRPFAIQNWYRGYDPPPPGPLISLTVEEVFGILFFAIPIVMIAGRQIGIARLRRRLERDDDQPS